MEGSELRDRLLQLLTSVYEEREVTLSSGAKSNYYIDGRQITLTAEGVRLAAQMVLEAISDDAVDAVGGPTIGADPLVGAILSLSFHEGRPLRGFLVRSAAKEHGTGRLIEGPPLQPGDRVIIVDDVLTTGGSIRRAISAAEEAGAVVARVVVLVDREEGGSEALRRDGYGLTALFTGREIGEAKGSQK